VGTADGDLAYCHGGDDTLHGAGFFDELFGGEGDDTFLYVGGGDVGPDLIFGGIGTDRILLQGAGVYELRNSLYVESIEEIEFGFEDAAKSV